MNDLAPLMAIISLFVILPVIIFHYITQWKRMRTLSGDDEQLMDDLHETARRLEDRLNSIERILAAENPNWRKGQN